MPRIQGLSQQHFLERQIAPTSSRMFSGISGASEGVPKMHPLKSSMGAAFKATSLIHGLRMAKMKTMRTGLKPMGMPKMPHL